MTRIYLLPADAERVAVLTVICRRISNKIDLKYFVDSGADYLLATVGYCLGALFFEGPYIDILFLESKTWKAADFSNGSSRAISAMCVLTFIIYTLTEKNKDLFLLAIDNDILSFS